MKDYERLLHEERDLRTPQLVGLEGWRVEVIDKYGKKRRFIVGTSMGPWKVHIELKRADSSGGYCAEKEYLSVRAIEQVWEPEPLYTTREVY